MTIVVTRDVPGRFRGFLASSMLEIAPGVYVAPRMTRGVRERLWNVLSTWYTELQQGAVVMAWRKPGAPGSVGLAFLGEPPKALVEYEGLVLVRREISSEGGTDL